MDKSGNESRKVEKSLPKIKWSSKELEHMGQQNSVITLHNLSLHRQITRHGFENYPTARLVNPSKNKIGRLSEVILDEINIRLHEAGK